MVNVKVGDDVVVWEGGWKCEYSIGRVLRITPTGQVVLEDGTRYLPDGWRIGGSSRIEPATVEARAQVRRQELQRGLGERLKRLQCELVQMDLADLERLGEVLTIDGAKTNG